MNPGEKILPILIVDDDEFILKFTTKMLNGLGFSEIHCASRAEVALEYLRGGELAVGLIFLDLNMPDMDGIEFLRELANLCYSGKIVLMSGENERTLSLVENLAKARDLDILGSMKKPLRAESVRSLLDQWEEWGQISAAPAGAAGDSISVSELRSAIENNELEPWFQPKIDMRTGAPVGVEMLARWRRDGHYVSPGVFIPIAENSQLIDPLTYSLFGRAMKWVKAWQQSGVDLHLAINIPIRSLYDLDFTDQFLDLMSSVDIALILEIPQSRLMEDLVTPLDNLLRLHIKKIGIAVDDFGLEAGNLASLKDLPLTELKLHRGLMKGATNDPQLRSRLQETVTLARQMELTTVAEGIEKYSDWSFARDQGCDLAQGFFLSTPMPGYEVTEWVKSWRSGGGLMIDQSR